MAMSYTVPTGGEGDVFTKSIRGVGSSAPQCCPWKPEKFLCRDLHSGKTGSLATPCRGFHGELVQSRGGASENGQRGEDSAGYFSVNVTQARAIWEGNLKEENAPIGKSDGGIFLVND